MFTLNHPPGRTAFVNGKEYLFFSGYSYLGMSHVPEFVSLLKDGLDKYGLLHPSSRISNTRLSIFQEMEGTLSQLTSQEETVIYSSGFLAGRAVVEYLQSQSLQAFILPSTHPALQFTNAIKLNEDWQQNFSELIADSNANEIIIVFDSINPLTATINDLSFLNNIPVNKKVVCVIDDSHGIGLLGAKGEGISAVLPQLTNVEYIITYSLSKAFHINGGAVSCSKQTASSLKQSAFYTASTSIAPSLCYAFINSQHLYTSQRNKLNGNTEAILQEAGKTQHAQTHPQLPIVVFHSILDQEYFLLHNIIISSFSYPNPEGPKINRAVISALHNPQDISRLFESLH